MFKFYIIISLFYTVYAEVYFEEEFQTDTWRKDWIYSEHPKKEFGKFQWSHGKFWHNASTDKGIQTSDDAKFYALSKKFPPFSNKNETFVLQFTVKHEQNIDCGGGYIKVFDCSLNEMDLHGDTPYLFMFGPDICGPDIKKVHVIFNYQNKNHLIKEKISCKDDVFTHLYTFIINSDNTYEVLIDNESVQKGNLEDDWDFLPPKKIKDPSATKPDDWDERATIPDPTDKKPDDWDQPEKIPDPDAQKPADWDDEMDGKWEAALIKNPNYKGVWEPKQIENLNYNGTWIHPIIDNPDYKPDSELYKKDEICAVGFDLWQVKSGTIFDNILITDDPEYAKAKGQEVWKLRMEGEKKMKEKLEDEEKSNREKEMKENTDNKEINDDEDEDDVQESVIPELEEHDEL